MDLEGAEAAQQKRFKFPTRRKLTVRRRSLPPNLRAPRVVETSQQPNGEEFALLKSVSEARNDLQDRYGRTADPNATTTGAAPPQLREPGPEFYQHAPDEYFCATESYALPPTPASVGSQASIIYCTDDVGFKTALRQRLQSSDSPPDKDTTVFPPQIQDLATEAQRPTLGIAIQEGRNFRFDATYFMVKIGQRMQWTLESRELTFDIADHIFSGNVDSFHVVIEGHDSENDDLLGAFTISLQDLVMPPLSAKRYSEDVTAPMATDRWYSLQGAPSGEVRVLTIWDGTGKGPDDLAAFGVLKSAANVLEQYTGLDEEPSSSDDPQFMCDPCSSYVHCLWMRAEKELIAAEREHGSLKNVPPEDIRQTIWKFGAPESFRIMLYSNLAGATAKAARVDDNYFADLGTQSERNGEPLAGLLSSDYEDLATAQRSILAPYLLRNPQAASCDGLVKVASQLSMHAEEEVVFWLIAAICEDLFPGYYTASMWGVVRDVKILQEKLLPRLMPEFHAHCQTAGFPHRMIATCFLSLFTAFSSEVMSWRIYDLIFVQGRDMTMHVLFVLLRHALPELLKSTTAEEMNVRFARSCKRWRDTYEFDKAIQMELLSLPLNWRDEDVQAEEKEAVALEAPPMAPDTNGHAFVENDVSIEPATAELEEAPSVAYVHVVIIGASVMSRDGAKFSSSSLPYCCVQLGHLSSETGPADIDPISGKLSWNVVFCFTTFAELNRRPVEDERLQVALMAGGRLMSGEACLGTAEIMLSSLVQRDTSSGNGMDPDSFDVAKRCSLPDNTVEDVMVSLKGVSGLLHMKVIVQHLTENPQASVSSSASQSIPESVVDPWGFTITHGVREWLAIGNQAKLWSEAQYFRWLDVITEYPEVVLSRASDPTLTKRLEHLVMGGISGAEVGHTIVSRTMKRDLEATFSARIAGFRVVSGKVVLFEIQIDAGQARWRLSKVYEDFLRLSAEIGDKTCAMPGSAPTAVFAKGNATSPATTEVRKDNVIKFLDRTMARHHTHPALRKFLDIPHLKAEHYQAMGNLRYQLWNLFSDADHESAVRWFEQHKNVESEADWQTSGGSKADFDWFCQKNNASEDGFDFVYENEEEEASILRILKAFLLLKPGYKTSAHLVLCGLFRVVQEETMTFAIMQVLSSKILPLHFSNDSTIYRVEVSIFRTVLANTSPDVLEHCDGLGHALFDRLISRWISSMLMTGFPKITVFRLWDVLFFKRGPEAQNLVVFFLVAFVKSIRPQILQARSMNECTKTMNYLALTAFDCNELVTQTVAEMSTMDLELLSTLRLSTYRRFSRLETDDKREVRRALWLRFLETVQTESSLLKPFIDRFCSDADSGAILGTISRFLFSRTNSTKSATQLDSPYQAGMYRSWQPCWSSNQPNMIQPESFLSEFWGTFTTAELKKSTVLLERILQEYTDDGLLNVLETLVAFVVLGAFAREVKIDCFHHLLKDPSTGTVRGADCILLIETIFELVPPSSGVKVSSEVIQSLELCRGLTLAEFSALIKAQDGLGALLDDSDKSNQEKENGWLGPQVMLDNTEMNFRRLVSRS